MYNTPTILQVPLPTGNFERNYGIYSTKHKTAQRIVFRITQSNKDIVLKAAKMLQMTEAQFSREATTNMAKVILKHAEEHNAHPDDRSR